jgi:protein-S-isoprenylcysteine O-methyltransferase Ste14
VWSGGALFVLSLAACAYAYIVTWGGPAATAASPPSAAVVVNVVLFSIFALHHSLFARESVKDRVGRLVRPALIRSVYVWTASVLLLLVLALWQPVAGDLYTVTGWPGMVLVALQLAGVVLIARSVSRIDALELAGIKPGSPADSLQIEGPYRWVRHPLYLGWIVTVFAAPHMTGNRLAFAAISTAYLLIAIPWEEQALRRTFGADYAAYQHSVRWRVLPFVY